MYSRLFTYTFPDKHNKVDKSLYIIELFKRKGIFAKQVTGK